MSPWASVVRVSAMVVIGIAKSDAVRNRPAVLLRPASRSATRYQNAGTSITPKCSALSQKTAVWRSGALSSMV